MTKQGSSKFVILSSPKRLIGKRVVIRVADACPRSFHAVFRSGNFVKYLDTGENDNRLIFIGEPGVEVIVYFIISNPSIGKCVHRQ